MEGWMAWWVFFLNKCVKESAFFLLATVFLCVCYVLSVCPNTIEGTHPQAPETPSFARSVGGMVKVKKSCCFLFFIFLAMYKIREFPVLILHSE